MIIELSAKKSMSVLCSAVTGRGVMAWRLRGKQYCKITFKDRETAKS